MLNSCKITKDFYKIRLSENFCPFSVRRALPITKRGHPELWTSSRIPPYPRIIRKNFLLGKFLFQIHKQDNHTPDNHYQLNDRRDLGRNEKHHQGT